MAGKQQQQRPPEPPDRSPEEVLGALAEFEKMLSDPLDATRFASLALLADPEPGPKYKAWQERLRKEFGKQLRAKGFQPNEIRKILKDLFELIMKPTPTKLGKFLFKQFKRLKDAMDAYKEAKKEVGPPPPMNE